MDKKISSYINKLYREHALDKAEWVDFIGRQDEVDTEQLFRLAREVREQVYGKEVFMRGLIEFTNYCKNDCYYCGIRRGNTNAQRYRLTEEEILSCCETGYRLGFRTFVLQGGEDPYFTDEKLERIVSRIHTSYPECVLTLSLGERSRESYARLFQAGARRYLLRHETANEAHYQKLHPQGMRLTERKACLETLKEIGYQVGCGFMVGSPGQGADCLADDMLLIQQLQPQMVGIGPFIPHKDTPFGEEAGGTLELTLFLLALVRLILPKGLLPATTALGTIHPKGRELGILAGANVVMPNLSPVGVRKKYLLYDGKICTGDEAAECLGCMTNRMKQIGHELVISAGNHADFARH